MNAILKAFLLSPAGLTLIGLAGSGALGWLGTRLLAWLASKPKLSALEPLAQDAEGVALAAEKAALDDLAAGRPSAAAKDALAALEAQAKADVPDAAKALAAEAALLVDGPRTTAVTPGGTVNLPGQMAITGTVSKPGQRGIVPLVVILIIGGIMLLGGGIALFATGNGKQALSCLDSAISGNPAAVGNLVSGLSKNDDPAIESAIGSFEPTLGKCVLVSLWDDYQAEKAAKAAVKAKASPVAPVAQIQAAAQVQSVKRGWYPAGMVVVPAK